MGFALSILLSIVFLILFLWVLYMLRNNNYWKKKNVPFLNPVPVFGNILDIFLLKSSIGEICQKIYNSTTLPFIGMFVLDEPYLVVRDLDLVKSILVKDFTHFLNRSMTNNKDADPMGSHILFLMKTPDWRDVRKKMTPAFTSGKMKLMHKLLRETGEDLLHFLNTRIPDNAIVESRELCAKYTTDGITSTSFGLKGNCFLDENAPFRVIARRIYNWEMFWHAVQTTCYFVAPTLVKIFGMRFIDKHSSDFLRDVFWKTMHERENNNVVRNDLIDILIQIRKEEHIDDPFKLEGDKLVAQATQFFIAGYETSSSTMSFALYELAKNPDVQEKVRREILQIKEKYGELSYEALQDMVYLDKCVKETLRKYPIVPFLDRRCNTDYKIPNTNIVLEKGTALYIPILGIQYDPQYFPEPNKFKPERFNDENKDQLVPYSYLSFGEGPRNCIGNRYGHLSSKTGIAYILSQYEVQTCEETQKEMIFNPRGFLLQPVNGIKLKFVKLSK